MLSRKQIICACANTSTAFPAARPGNERLRNRSSAISLIYRISYLSRAHSREECMGKTVFFSNGGESLAHCSNPHWFGCVDHDLTIREYKHGVQRH